MITAKQTTIYGQYVHIMMMSAWGIVMVVCSFLFLYIGYKLDRYFNTEPTFMLGLFMLGLLLCIGRLYQDAWLKRNG
jgi:F0F1-type ATP synthase assembly protein I